MINIFINTHTEILNLVKNKKITSDDFFILLCITKRIGKQNKSFPSISTLMEESNFGRNKICKCIKNLESQKLIEKTQRRVYSEEFNKNIFGTNSYILLTDLITYEN